MNFKPQNPNPKIYINGNQAAEMLGLKMPGFYWMRKHHPVKFPDPAVTSGVAKYWKKTDVEAWQKESGYKFYKHYNQNKKASQ